MSCHTFTFLHSYILYIYCSSHISDRHFPSNKRLYLSYPFSYIAIYTPPYTISPLILSITVITILLLLIVLHPYPLFQTSHKPYVDQHLYNTIIYLLTPHYSFHSFLSTTTSTHTLKKRFSLTPPPPIFAS